MNDCLAAIVANPNKAERLQYFRQTLATLSDLRQDGKPVQVVCAFEARHETPWLNELKEILDLNNVRACPHYGSPSLAANLNNLIRSYGSDPLVIIHDDCPLRKPLDVSVDLQFLSRNQWFGVIRYTREDSPIKGMVNRAYYWLDRDYFPYYSHKPHLRRPGIEQCLGFFDEELAHFPCETQMSVRFSGSPVKVLMRPEVDFFEHIGVVSSHAE